MANSECTKGSFLEHTKAAREERAHEKKREWASTVIQAHVRGWLTRKKYCRRVLEDFDKTFPNSENIELKPCLQIYQITSRFLYVWQDERDKERFEKLCRYLVASLESDSIKLSYIGVGLNKEYALSWIPHMKDILWKCCCYLDGLRPEFPSDMRTILLYLHTLVAFTSTNTWIILRAKHMEVLKPGLNQLCANIMGHLFTKGFYHHLKHVSISAILTLALRPLISSGFSEKLMTMFLIHILSVPALVLHLQNLAPESNLTHWHPVLGWFAQGLNCNLHEAMPYVKTQLYVLWSGPVVTVLLDKTLADLVENLPDNYIEGPSSSGSSNILKRALDHRANRTNAAKYHRKLGSPDCTKVALICSLYHTALETLTQLRLDILTGLCYQDRILFHLWLFLSSLGPNCGLKAFLELLAVNTKCSAPEFQMLILFCDCMTHYVTILDDLEMYEQQKPFRLTDFVNMSTFLNHILYKDVKSLNTNSMFQSLHTLLMVLYRRDCRRSYTPDNHWLIKDLRVVLGLTESACVSPQSTLIAVHRCRIVEDGYRQLALLPPQALKGVIRVRFINEQGLDEAGIDQDGVFKEFLEETIKRVFDPSLNLFRVTSEERLYPSPTSYMQDNHLQLFEFGIVVDVPFASFFLSQLLGQQHQALYSSMDELPSLDRELYRSLTFIKHHQGDVQDLDLTFSVDEDCLGKLVTHELVPGGKAIPVTNENKINYIHMMAHFRMHTQIKDQTAAFIRGFRSLINPEWLSIFSTPELQRLISGDNVPLDLRDLRRHTHYYGGFHDSHRVVCWLWDILDKDFTDEERRLFLKFVTSCSKPPLLGFAHLEPPFSIRCVEVGDDEDTGDTIGSVIRGFFTIRKKDPQNRLPTSSTCFNLLKLPNYQKKSTLRDKLRYAVSSNTGFELS
ncbi:Ubiquitin-protein ligase E3B [Blattella germanica]|nr:Ubiquitin-protein ligase E3B [Blattella germanica]